MRSHIHIECVLLLSYNYRSFEERSLPSTGPVICVQYASTFNFTTHSISIQHIQLYNTLHINTAHSTLQHAPYQYKNTCNMRAHSTLQHTPYQYENLFNFTTHSISIWKPIRLYNTLHPIWTHIQLHNTLHIEIAFHVQARNLRGLYE